MEVDVLADDLLDGVAAIATWTGFTARRVYYLCEKGLRPRSRSAADGVRGKASYARASEVGGPLER